MGEFLKKYRKDLLNKLQNLCVLNIREYWNIFNNLNKIKKCFVDIDILYNFFKILNENEGVEICDNIID